MTTSNCTLWLEVDLAHEFEHPRVASTRDRAERGAPKTSIRIIQRRGVGYIERFRAKFEPRALSNAKCLADHQVRILKSRPTDWIARIVPDDKLWGVGKTRRIEELCNTTAAKLIRVADPVRPLHGITKTGIVVRGLRNQNGVTGLYAHQARNFPTRNLPQSRDGVNPSKREHPRNIAGRYVFF